MPRYALYVEKSSPIHSLDPRTKMFWLLNVFIWTSVFNHPLYTAGVLAIVLTMAILAGTLKEMKFALYGLASLAGTSFVLWPIFRNWGTTVAFSIGPYTLYQESVLYATAVAIRLVAMVLSGLVLLTTTKIEAMEVALTRAKLPYPIAFATTAIFRFIPTMMGDAQMVFAAQQARGVDLLRGNLLTKTRNSVSIIVPLFITTLRRFGELPVAIESRGFVPFAPRTSLIAIKFRIADIIVMIGVAAATALFIYLRLSGYGAIYPQVV
jgi:energy-coupling factor transport system permease protein